MTLSERLAELVRALFTALVVQTDEPDDALASIARLCRDQDWTLAVWDIDRGLHGDTRSTDAGGDPLAPLDSRGDGERPHLVVLQNFHPFLRSPEVIQRLYRRCVEGRQDRTVFVLLSPSVELPPELSRLFAVLRHELPGRDELQAIAEGVATEDGELPEDSSPLLDAAAGLTRLEAENAFSLSLVRDGRLSPDAVWERKVESLGRDGLLRISRSGSGGGFDRLGGLDALKSFAVRSLTAAGDEVEGRPTPRGVLLLGPAGVGKSAWCRALGSETGRPTVHLDVGSLMGSLVGQSEANLRRALATIDAMGKCVVFLDEVEKALAGTASSGQSDSGTTARLFGSLLSWLESGEDRGAYVVASANDISRLPPEFTRAGRFDGVFFLDLPDAAVRESIWPLYLIRYGLEADSVRPDDDGWTGAEIESCCRLASLLGEPLVEVARSIVPVSVTASESIAGLRDWAAGRCLDAEAGGIYRKPERPSGSRRRTVRPSAN